MAIVNKVDVVNTPIPTFNKREIVVTFYTNQNYQNYYKYIEGWHCFEIRFKQASEILEELKYWVWFDEIDGLETEFRIKPQNDRLKIAFYNQIDKEVRETSNDPAKVDKVALNVKGDYLIYGFKPASNSMKQLYDEHSITLTNQEAREFKKKLSKKLRAAGKKVS